MLACLLSVAFASAPVWTVDTAEELKILAQRQRLTGVVKVDVDGVVALPSLTELGPFAKLEVVGEVVSLPALTSVQGSLTVAASVVELPLLVSAERLEVRNAEQTTLPSLEWAGWLSVAGGDLTQLSLPSLREVRDGAEVVRLQQLRAVKAPQLSYDSAVWIDQTGIPFRGVHEGALDLG